MSEQPTQSDKLGGRKASAFYACLLVTFILAISGKAETHVLGLIDTLFFIYAGANVVAKRYSPAQPQPQQPDSRLEKPS
jgi:hypothetical protein